MFFKDADDLDFAESGFLHGVSSRPLASEFSTYCRSLFQATRQIETLVVRIFFPLTPVLLWAGREIWDASESAKSVSHLREALAEMWDAMIDSQIDESSAEEKSIEIQSAIYSYRINTFPIPNLIYKLLRVKTAENLRHVAESRLSQYQIKFAKII